MNMVDENKYLEALNPYLERVPKLEEIPFKNIKIDWHKFTSTKVVSFDEYKKLWINSHHIRCAEILRAIENSWAQYETQETLLEILPHSFKMFPEKLLSHCLYLRNNNLIEMHVTRIRRKQ